MCVNLSLYIGFNFATEHMFLATVEVNTKQLTVQILHQKCGEWVHQEQQQQT
jgi:hypothetical protein